MGTITRYETDDTPQKTLGARRKAPKVLGLTVGHAVAIKITDRRGKEETRLGLVFNEMTDSPEVVLLPKSLEVASLQKNLAEEVADKVRRFPEHIAKVLADKKVEEAKAAAEVKSSEVEEI